MKAIIYTSNTGFTRKYAQMLSEKLIRRHPHVFGDAKRPETPEESLALWKEVKKKEKGDCEGPKQL